jgi:hypothetical protein
VGLLFDYFPHFHLHIPFYIVSLLKTMWYWGLNSGLHAYQPGVLQLEPCLFSYSIFILFTFGVGIIILKIKESSKKWYDFSVIIMAKSFIEPSCEGTRDQKSTLIMDE